jgi:general secretion pathway protein C
MSKFTFLVPILLALLIAKAVWVGLEIYKLPKSGVDQEKQSSLKALYYHYTLASKKELPKVIVKRNKPTVVVKPKPKPEKFTKFILRGIYNSKERKVIMVEYLGKSYALALGEEVEGYKFTKLYPTYAIFSKNGKEYRLDLYKKDKNTKENRHSSATAISAPVSAKAASKNNTIQRAGDTTFIPKNLFNKYRNDIGAIRKSIGVVPNTANGKLNGFKIRYVKRGSDFDKLGIKRGDIITAINGEPLNNFKVPLEFFNNLDSMSAATLTIKRGNEIKELDYEVR